MVNKIMGAEVEAICDAGYRERSRDTRVGTIDLQIPKLRHGTCFPGWLRERPLTGPYKYIRLDALFMKCRERSRPASTARAARDPRRGCRRRRDRSRWLAFSAQPARSKIEGRELVVSDAHLGLQHAIASVLSGAAWHRCRTHFIRNLLTKVPKAAHGIVATFVRTIFAQPDAESVRAHHARTVKQLRPRFAAAAKMLAEVETKALTKKKAA